MVDKEAPGKDAPARIIIARPALHSCAKIVLEEFIKHCVRDGIEQGDTDKTIEECIVADTQFLHNYSGDYRHVKSVLSGVCP